MSAFPNWHKFAVVQRRPKTGCIPTGYEMLARATGVRDIDFASFQDDFDLDKDKDFNAGDKSENNFGSVAKAIQRKYPQLIYECVSFDISDKKIQFIDDQISQQHPVLLSLEMTLLTGEGGWHIMPVVDSDDKSFTLLYAMKANGEPDILKIKKQVVAYIHDNYEGGKEVAILKHGSAT